MVLEAPELPVVAVLFGEALDQLDADADEADDAAGGDEARGVEAAGADLAFGVERGRDAGGHGQAGGGVEVVGVGGVEAGVKLVEGGAVGLPEVERGLVELGDRFGMVMQHGAIDHPAHDAADEDG